MTSASPADLPTDPTPRRGGLWHHADFRRLWIGDTASQFGTMITMLALPLLAVTGLHASPFEAGLLAACETIAFLIVGLPAGAWVDRMRHRGVMIVNDLIRAAALSSLPVAAAMDALSMGQLYLVALVVGSCTVFFDVAYQSYLPRLVGREHLVEGNAKLQASQSVAQIAGPGVGGLLVQALTAPFALLLNAVTLLWSAGWLARIQHREVVPEPVPGTNLRTQIAEGLRFVVGHRLLRSIVLTTALSNLFGAMSSAVLLILLARDLGLAAGTIGLLMSAGAVGGLLGALGARRIAGRLGQGPTIWIGALVLSTFAFVPPFLQRGWMLWAYAASNVLCFAATVVYNITQVSFRQALCPEHLLGRMNATIRFVVWGILPIGGLLGGAMGSWLGVRDALLVAAVGGMVAFLPAYLSPLRRMRELPTEPG